MVVGRWVSGEKALDFYGRGIGRSIQETVRYFRYTFPSEDRIVLNFGGGSSNEFTISVASNELRLVDAGGQETVYSKGELDLNPCVENLRQLDGAMALFALDHDGMPAGSPRELVPVYLPELPVCPDGGIYNLTGAGGHPVCTVAGHRLAP